MTVETTGQRQAGASGSGAGTPIAGMPSDTPAGAAAPPSGLPRVAGAGTAHAEHRPVGDQVVRGGVGDLDGDHVAGPRRSPRSTAEREVHQPVVGAAAGEPVGGGVLAALPLGDHQLDAAADEPLVLLPRDVVDQRDQPLVAVLDDSRGTCSSSTAAGVPGRLEYWNVNAPENRASRTTCIVSRKSSSVSPGKPTMMSVVIAASGIAARTRSMMPRNFACR